jgi:tetratricopeptide (TPR) repeat protein
MFNSAEKELSCSIRIDKNFADSYFYLGKIYTVFKSTSKAIFHLRNYLKLQPKNEFKKIVLQDIWKLFGLKVADKAGEANYSIVKLYPNKQLNILYYSIFPSAKGIKLHWGINNWKNVCDNNMVNEIDNLWFITIDISPDVKTVEFTFLSDKGECDNNKGKDWKIFI